MKPGIEQVGKDGLPPLLRHVGAKSASGGNHPSLLVLFQAFPWRESRRLIG
jgi:hypothetical protein